MMRAMPEAPEGPRRSPIESISALTLEVSDMAASVAFYESLGFARCYGGPDESFTCFEAGTGWLNLQLDPALAPIPRIWGRVIFWVDDVDAMHARALAAGHTPEMPPSDAPWGERYFHLRDPDGHELSFARRLGR
jgi:catechol 2,3-dioxygenase-like lactoylglutathione lyase family enzyme